MKYLNGLVENYCGFLFLRNWKVFFYLTLPVLVGLELVQGTNKNKLIKDVNRVPFWAWYRGHFDSVLTAMPKV